MAERYSFLFGTKRYVSNVAPAAPAGSVNVIWRSDGENLSASVAVGGIQTPWLQQIDGAGYGLANAGQINSANGATASAAFDGAAVVLREYKRLGAQGAAAD